MITNVLKNDVANYVSDSITEVVLNHSISITDFSKKEAENNITTVNFTIEKGTGTIEHIQIKSNEKVLSESDMYLEINAEVQFSYRLEVMDFE